jgi:hypothetical protein
VNSVPRLTEEDQEFIDSMSNAIFALEKEEVLYLD